MTLSNKAASIIEKIDLPEVKMGDLKKLAKEIKKDHDLAMELWSTKHYYPMLFSTLIMDKKLVDQAFVDQLVIDLEDIDLDERNRITEWFLANQLMKGKNTLAMLDSWQHNSSPTLRRLFWYYQARLRWTGKIQDNSGQLMEALEKEMATETPEVQWTMNFTAGWIGVFEEKYRDKCIELGKKNGLYKDEKVPKNCTPNYLPGFIETELGKRK
ncbi:DNA alkylation repair protein [Acidaminobacter sp. JC074]|uniref:hypothetical protein n=1 Tax=Acidaminobacter sp. JC074 TaxID=2530199 RepID=UPI001F0E74EB|nr:hypothetical protein [Acidaminobacter sp. JC074]MCH4887842.1 DNA alkylation repair protein [Acidaminobacter sp. JC074]